MNSAQKLLYSTILVLVATLIIFRDSFTTSFSTSSQNQPQLSPTPSPLSTKPSFTATGPFRVASVIDGDTIQIKDGPITKTVRLVGIDTPETVDPRRPVGCFGREASDTTKSLLTGQEVYLEDDNPLNQVDKYGRLLKYVFRASDGLHVNAYLVENGFAHEYTYQGEPHRYMSDFVNLETKARNNNLGLWNKSICP